MHIHTYIHALTYTYLHIHTHTCTYMHIHTHTYTYMHIPTHTYTYIQIHTHTYTYMHIHAHTCTYTYTHIDTCIHTCTYIDIHIHIHLHIHIHIHIYIYIYRYVFVFIHTCLRIHLHKCVGIHTNIHIYISPSLPPSLPPSIHTYIHACIHSYAQYIIVFETSCLCHLQVKLYLTRKFFKQQNGVDNFMHGKVGGTVMTCQPNEIFTRAFCSARVLFAGEKLLSCTCFMDTFTEKRHVWTVQHHCKEVYKSGEACIAKGGLSSTLGQWEEGQRYMLRLSSWNFIENQKGLRANLGKFC